MNCDLHIHSRHSFDSRETLKEICCSAVRRNLGIVAVTDHCDMISGPEGIDYYLRTEKCRVEEYRQICREYPQLEVLYGIEIGNAIDRPLETQRFLQERSFDYVIGAIHFMPDGSDIYKLPYSDAKSVDRMFRSYFHSVEQLVQMGGFDSLAHLDYPLRVLKGKVQEPTIREYRELIESILEKLVCQGIALELNTRGVYDWQGRVGPEDWILERYRKLGGSRITIGSDAHTATKVGVGVEEAGEALLRAGFTSYTIYRERIPQEIPLRAERR